MKGTAQISMNGRYRYQLTRELYLLSEIITNRTILFIGLNPSTADSLVDDPTIRRCIGFAKQFGGSKLIMANLYAYRATDPQTLRHVDDPIGPENDFWINQSIEDADIVVCAWGGGRAEISQVLSVYNRIPEPFCLGVTAGGQPRHPLYLPKESPLIPYHMEVS